MPNNKPDRLWGGGGRFEESLSSVSEAISESISFDSKLYKFDIEASLAHADMLCRQKIISQTQFENIQQGLEQILTEFIENKITLKPSLEDIHTHVETRLVELIGDDGKRLHTGRSRNDQVATDTHLYLRSQIIRQKKLLKELLQTFVSLADEHKNTIWAGYTHTQIAQPILLGHYLLAYFEKFKRDLHLLTFVLEETDISPLGCGALAGPNYAVDREYSAGLLKFNSIYQNSMDAVSTRDYQLSYHYFASRLFIHTSRLCEDLILYNTAEFSYIKMTDAVTTGSSIMPQKKNPDIAELLRGKSARVIGNFNSLLFNLKSLPLTYNRDLQEDKIYLFDSVDQVDMALLGLKEILTNTFFDDKKIKDNLAKGFSQATDIADYFVLEKGMPFRKAHELSGMLVRECELKNLTLEELEPARLKEILGDEFNIPPHILSLQNSVSMKKGLGSTNPEEVAKQIQWAKDFLQKVEHD